MPWFSGTIALLAGMALAVQVGVNNGLKAKLGQPIAASAFSFATGTLALALYWLATWVVTRAPLPAPDKLRGGPWWAWLGGSLGAVYIVLTVTFSPKLGAAGWVGVVVAGQILTSVILDHFGLVGFPQHAISWPRVVGVALLLGGAALVLRS